MFEIGSEFRTNLMSSTMSNVVASLEGLRLSGIQRTQQAKSSARDKGVKSALEPVSVVSFGSGTQERCRFGGL